jgi:hypothetical protein
MVVGIDGAFVKAGHTRAGQRHQLEILTGRVEASQRGGEAFAVVRDLDPYAKKRVQAILRRCGRGQDTDLRILSDGEQVADLLKAVWKAALQKLRRCGYLRRRHDSDFKAR